MGGEIPRLELGAEPSFVPLLGIVFVSIVWGNYKKRFRDDSMNGQNNNHVFGGMCSFVVVVAYPYLRILFPSISRENGREGGRKRVRERETSR